MELAADIAEALDQCPFDMGVDVFELDRKGKLAAFDLAGNRGQRCDDLGGLLSGQETDVRKHAGVRLAGAHVMMIEPAVKTDRFGEGFDAVVGCAAEAAAPGLLAHGVILDQGLVNVYRDLRTQGPLPAPAASRRGAPVLVPAPGR